MSNRFKERRNELGLSAEQAAVKIGVTLGTLYSWERGDTKPNAKKLADMAVAYEVSADWLIGLEK
ncbi:helix-turn-helix transcriptional regulator [Parafannyhessea umbonata]|uniref:DNA-binding transcriptional regulator, XRE-family HTH domain n=1 Tax=Parafannyhessea umbonata TaxID=604330 RepID=A0A1H1L3Y6_9ACTN|nr:helix-turn-helix transcriptional regulator [Parafannyhessea umbonata]SDR68735.1 DNA-binding transcriptional regulator, XRE-family HTH domain [Parafannyhessea umbonata]